MRFSLFLCLKAALAVATPSFFSKSPIEAQGSLEIEDCQIRCPTSTDPGQVVLPALTQFKNASGHWENTIECWQVDTISTNLPGIDNAFRIDWEGGFDAAYQYIFYGQSFMPAHPAPEPSLILMSAGIGDLRVPSGRCLRVGAGDIFFSVGTDGRQTAWWSEGTVVSDFYFKGGRIPDHVVVSEVEAGKSTFVTQVSDGEL
ncbi:hypothetical protein DBV05_g8053 [Lasiodiplodia theobromae]|uniref:Uncharacterized protein n=1 Tax=Lasiodiplodia theobromae TaxID=45133 RepID=A0A5N5D7B3_9PEZI|nr:hypothetical protein DBV05_g8053 [Lasiodiplodia theobromae]